MAKSDIFEYVGELEEEIEASRYAKLSKTNKVIDEKIVMEIIGEFAIGSQHVGHASVAAAMVAHVVIVHDLGDQYAEQDAAQEIPAQCGQHAGQNNI